MIKPVRVVRNHAHLFIAAAIAVLVFAFLPGDLRPSLRALLGWDVGVLTYLVIAFCAVVRFDIKRVQVRAEELDEGAALLLIITVAAAIASLAAIVIELAAAHAAHAEKLAFALAAVTAALAWTLIHTIFAFRYAHLFYIGPGDRGSGLVFPEDDWPTYWDFVYFAFVVGMTFQVSDVQVTSKRLRRIVVAHGILSFMFSVAIIALTVNIGASLI